MSEMPPPVEGKPKLVFFRFPNPRMPRFLSMHLDDHVNCLRQFFDVTVVAENCDYDVVCDRLQPDLALFESGVYAAERRITNTHAHPDVPKLGFLNADAYSDTRAAFLSDMERWGVDTFFTLSVSAPEYTPEIADRLFIWPNSINPDVFRFYGAAKNIPVLVTGSQERHYPWRNRVATALGAEFPTMVCPHHGWEDSAGARRMIVGEDYARLLSAARFVPACGTIAKDVVRKHFEIPAAGALLVTEETAAITAAGFRDGINCVFADADTVVERLDALLQRPADYARIVEAGHALVHEQHTWQQRDELLQWLRLYRGLKPGEAIVQTGPFDGLGVTSSRPRNVHPMSGGVDRAMLSQAWAALDAGRFPAAERLFLGCMNYQYLPEAIVGLSHLHLLRGAPELARPRLSRALLTTMAAHGAADPDPVQWALWIRVLLCLGELPAAEAAARRFIGLRHVELDRIRQAIVRLTGEQSIVSTAGVARASMNPLPTRSAQDWADELRRMLRACRRERTASALDGWVPDPVEAAVEGGRIPTSDVDLDRQTSAVVAELRTATQLPTSVRARGKATTLVRRLTGSDLSRALERIVVKEPLSAVLVLGTPRRRGTVGALRAAAAANPARPPVELRRRCQAESVPAGRRDLMVYVGGGGHEHVRPVMSQTRLLVLETITTAPTHELFVDLAAGGEWTSLLQEQGRNGTGFAVFRRAGRAG